MPDTFCGPIRLTNTHSVGIAHHAAVQWMIGHYAREFADDHLWALPVVAETYDGVLNDINGQHVVRGGRAGSYPKCRLGVPFRKAMLAAAPA